MNVMNENEWLCDDEMDIKTSLWTSCNHMVLSNPVHPKPNGKNTAHMFILTTSEGNGNHGK